MIFLLGFLFGFSAGFVVGATWVALRVRTKYVILREYDPRALTAEALGDLLARDLGVAHADRLHFPEVRQ